jgi:hypothetical protein
MALYDRAEAGAILSQQAGGYRTVIPLLDGSTPEGETSRRLLPALSGDDGRLLASPPVARSLPALERHGVTLRP